MRTPNEIREAITVMERILAHYPFDRFQRPAMAARVATLLWVLGEERVEPSMGDWLAKAAKVFADAVEGGR